MVELKDKANKEGVVTPGGMYIYFLFKLGTLVPAIEVFQKTKMCKTTNL